MLRGRPARMADDVQVPGRLRPGRDGRGAHQGDVAQGVGVTLGQPHAALVPLVKMTELDAQERGLQLVHAAVDSLALMLVLGPRAIVPQQSDVFGQLVVIGSYGPSVTKGAEVFGGIET